VKTAISSLWVRLHAGIGTHSFKRLTQACALSSSGDAFVAVALAGSIFFSQDPTAARESVALSLLLTMAPFAVVAPLLGPWVDRVRGGRRFVLVFAAVMRSFLCLVMAMVLDSVLLYPVAFGVLVFSKTHAVAKGASVPEIVSDSNALVRANSLLSISAVLAGFVAAVGGYLISQGFGDDWLLRSAAFLFAIQAALSFEVGAVRQYRRQGGRRVRVGAALAKAGVVPAALVMATMRMTVGFLVFLVAFELRRIDAPTWWFGFAVGASLVGSSIGNLVAPHLRGRIREEWILVSCALAIAVSGIAVTQIEGTIAAVALAFLVGTFAGAAKLSFDSLVQRDAPAAIHGRAFARLEAAFQMAWVVGAFVPVVIVINADVGFVLLAAVCAAAGLWYGTARRNVPVAGA
jgi:MFS family permease